jgi:hypothetical protein
MTSRRDAVAGVIDAVFFIALLADQQLFSVSEKARQSLLTAPTTAPSMIRMTNTYSICERMSSRMRA